MSLTLVLYPDSQDELRFPAKYEVCPECRGKGTHVNKAIDGNGITQSEMQELGDDFRQDYLDGVYDVRCDECHGERVVLVLDEDRCTSEQRQQYEQDQRERWEAAALDAQELRMGC